MLRTILLQSTLFIFTPQAYPLLTTCFYLELTLRLENNPYIFWPKSVVFNTKLHYVFCHFYLQWKLKKHLLREKHAYLYVFQQHFPYQEKMLRVSVIWII